MLIIRKTSFQAFNWLDFDDLPKSKGYKFELYNDCEIAIDEFILQFYSLFKKFTTEIQIGQFGVDSKWGDFCIDTWDFENDKYDYTPENKTQSTSNYLKMLIENEIEPEYKGFCECMNWDEFLPIILDCILKHTAPYSLMFYIPSYNIVFYFHHTGSFGVYYKQLNEGVKHIIERSKKGELEIKNWSDSK